MPERYGKMITKSNFDAPQQPAPFSVLLVDDSEHESYFFENALNELPIPTYFRSIDGKGLIDHLAGPFELPDVLFLDLNMPVKNGFECLEELKLDQTFQHIPVIIYSHSYDKIVADELYKNGAHYYIQKADMVELKKTLDSILIMLQQKTFTRPSRDKFVLSMTGNV